MWTLFSLFAPKLRGSPHEENLFRPQVEGLEDRCCPSGAGALEWSDPSAGVSHPGVVSSIATAVLLQPWDGRIVLAGNSHLTNGSVVMSLARYNSDGSTDSTFGSGGTV